MTMTLEEAWPAFVAFKRLRVKPTTISAYAAMWRQIAPYFGPLRVDEIFTKRIEQWAFGELAHLSRRTVQARLVLVNNILDFVEYEYEIRVSKIQLRRIQWPSSRGGGMVAAASAGEVKGPPTFTAEELERIVDYVARNPSPAALAVALMVGTGCRIGEASALTYGDLDSTDGTVSITKTCGRMTLEEGDTAESLTRAGLRVIRCGLGTALVIGPAKTSGSHRRVPLPTELFRVLGALRKVYPAEYFIASNGPEPMEPRALREQYRRLLKAAGVGRYVRPHGLRHTFASALVTSGADVRTVAELLGHSDVKTTLEIYSHSSVSSKRKAIGRALAKPFKSIGRGGGRGGS